jgi:hypothetical protein
VSARQLGRGSGLADVSPCPRSACRRARNTLNHGSPYGAVAHSAKPRECCWALRPMGILGPAQGWPQVATELRPRPQNRSFLFRQLPGLPTCNGAAASRTRPTIAGFVGSSSSKLRPHAWWPDTVSVASGRGQLAQLTVGADRLDRHSALECLVQGDLVHGHPSALCWSRCWDRRRSHVRRHTKPPTSLGLPETCV